MAPLRELAAPGLTDKCLEIITAWDGFDGSGKSIAKIGARIGEMNQMISKFNSEMEIWRNSDDERKGKET